MGVITLVYRGILALVLLLTVRCCYEEKNFWKQATAALVVVPLLLRLFMIK
ncbi:MAG: hypothetical protein LBQ42_08620 [Synergistaceae bacterium]|jgi:hypothetical protein|nr:hypothetical protein [Synergistaceae bacterium]